MRGPLAALTERLGRRRPDGAASPPAVSTPPLGPEMGRGSVEMQRRLEQARERLRRDIAPPPDDDDPA